ncbi:ATP-binding cassette domain-containing protein [Sediminicola arcticus]|jgi:molybdate transport system ATP-binding protein|uniref:ATP-binding cassette domain-containing protein n=1 Tax=Sediminicola arcticus TaxID=1574308 RepID=A0ABV2STD2_9FLAO
MSIPSKIEHWGIVIDNTTPKVGLVDHILKTKGTTPFESLKGLKGALFSPMEIVRLLEEEERHDNRIVTLNTKQSLKSMSSGERKKALLSHILKNNPDFIILDNPFDNLDSQSQEQLAGRLKIISKKTPLILLITRKADRQVFITNYYTLKQGTLQPLDNATKNNLGHTTNDYALPPPLKPTNYKEAVLIEFKNVTVSYDNRTILNNINWTIRPREFWQLKGKNGSGKSTLLSMITGENNKGYGQLLWLFGQQKGSGETIWDIKEKLGYFTPSMIDSFSGHHTVEHMLISGLYDTIGLYIYPPETEIQLAKEWLQVLDLLDFKTSYFHDLSMGQQRLIMTARAMIKHPLVLLLDEATSGLDDKSSALLVALVNKIAAESKTTIIFVSHRHERGLQPQFIFDLQMTDNGSVGKKIIP